MKYIYEVQWDSDMSYVKYTQDFETIEDARIALALHNKRNAVLTVKEVKE
jgi:hypothetical protein